MRQAALPDGLTAAAVDIGGREVAEARMSAPMVVVTDEGFDPRPDNAVQAGVLEQDAVRQGLVPARDPALDLGRRGPCATRAFLFPPDGP
jgi:hypothetical protein